MNRNRRTRDRVRLIFWAALTLVCFLLVVAARQQQASSLDRKVDAAGTRATRYANVVVRDHLSRDLVSAPLPDGPFRELLAEVQRKVLIDGRVARVLVWGPDGGLVFSTEGPVAAGTDRTAHPGAFGSASTGTVVSGVATVTLPARAEHPRGPTDVLQTYVPLRTESGEFFGAVEVDQYYDVLVDGSSRPWRQLQMAFGAVALVCAVMVLLSFWWSLKPMSDAEVAARLDRAALRGAKIAGREGAKQTKRDTKAIVDATSEVEKLRAKLDEAERAKEASKQQAKQLQEQMVAADQQVQAARSELSSAQRATQDVTETLRLAGETERQLRAEIEILRREAAQVPEPATGPSAEAFEAMKADLERARDEVQEAQAAARRSGAEAEELRAWAEQLRAGTEQVRLEADEAVADAELARRRAEEATKELDAVRASVEEARAAQGFTSSQLAEAQRRLDETPVHAAVAAIPIDAKARIEELEEQVRGLEQERAMLRAGRPETVYEVRNRELEAELKDTRERLKSADHAALDAKAMAAGLAPNVLVTLEERLTAAERRADEAERRLAELEPSPAPSSNGGSGNGSAADEPEPEIDGSELRSRLVRAADRKRMGSEQKPRH